MLPAERNGKAKAAFQFLMRDYVARHVGDDPAGAYLLDMIGARNDSPIEEEPPPSPKVAAIVASIVEKIQVEPDGTLLTPEQQERKRLRSETMKANWATRKAKQETP